MDNATVAIMKKSFNESNQVIRDLRAIIYILVETKHGGSVNIPYEDIQNIVRESTYGNGLKEKLIFRKEAESFRIIAKKD